MEQPKTEAAKRLSTKKWSRENNPGGLPSLPFRLWSCGDLRRRGRQTRNPPLKYLFCRAKSFGELTATTRAAGKLPGIEFVQKMLHGEMLLRTSFLHRITQERIEAWSKARRLLG